MPHQGDVDAGHAVAPPLTTAERLTRVIAQVEGFLDQAAAGAPLWTVETVDTLDGPVRTQVPTELGEKLNSALTQRDLLAENRGLLTGTATGVQPGPAASLLLPGVFSRKALA